MTEKAHGLHLAMEVFVFVYVEIFSSRLYLHRNPISWGCSAQLLRWVAIIPEFPKVANPTLLGDLCTLIGKLWTLLAGFLSNIYMAKVVSVSWSELLCDLDNGCLAGEYIFRGHFGICPTKKVVHLVRCSSGICYSCIAATSCSYGTYTFLAHRYGDVYCVAVSEDTFSTIFFPRGVLVNFPFPVHKKRPCSVKTQILLDLPEVEVQDDLRLIYNHSTYILHISN